MIPVREALGLDGTTNCSKPLPTPEPPAVTWIHGTLGTAVQLHLPVTSTRTFPVPPVRGSSVEFGAKDQEHCDA